MERIPYGEHPSQFAELVRPPGPGPHPVVVLLHGGFWRQRYDRTLMSEIGGDLVRRGAATWNVEYRRVGFRAGGGWPSTCDDVTAAVERLALVDGLDLTRVRAVGHSAGGHLAAWLAGTNDRRSVQLAGACAQAGVVDLAAADRHPLCRKRVRKFLGGPPSAHPGADPAELEQAVPVLCVHGRADDTVPLAVSEAFCARHQAAALQTFAGGHMEHIDPASAMWQAAAAWLTTDQTD